MHDLTGPWRPVEEGAVTSQERVARRIVVAGRVQGVFFRTATRQQAQRHGVAGWVANRPDGTVETWLEGPPDAVEAVEAWILTGGPPAAEVRHYDLTVETPQGHTGFEVRRG
jgi:acylphosphatase